MSSPPPTQTLSCNEVLSGPEGGVAGRRSDDGEIGPGGLTRGKRTVRWGRRDAHRRPKLLAGDRKLRAEGVARPSCAERRPRWAGTWDCSCVRPGMAGQMPPGGGRPRGDARRRRAAAGQPRTRRAPAVAARAGRSKPDRSPAGVVPRGVNLRPWAWTHAFDECGVNGGLCHGVGWPCPTTFHVGSRGKVPCCRDLRLRFHALAPDRPQICRADPLGAAWA